jgi:hypothetical protein
MIEIFKRNTLLLLMLITGLSSCEKSKDVDTVVEKEPINTPGMAQGTLPENGEPCADVEGVSGEPLKVSVLFQWTSAEFADNYDLRVFESQNEVYNETLTSLETTVELDRGKSYSWSITAKNDDGETVGSTFSFTTPGEPIGNYVPYAAVITVEFNAMTSEMGVSWIGSDEDGDTLTYDVLIKEDEKLLVEFTNLSVDFLDLIPFIPTSSYSFEVISKDNFGNFSISKHNEIAPN